MWSLEVMGTVARQHAYLGFQLSETEGDPDRHRKGWSAGGGQSLCGGDEGRINMKSRCLDLATKWRLTDVARGEQELRWVGLEALHHIICTQLG